MFTFKTNLNALKYKLVSVDFNDASPVWRDLVPEKEDVLQTVVCVNQNKLLLNYMHDCKDDLYLYDLITGKEFKKFQLDIGTILDINGRKKDDFVNIFFMYRVLK